MNEIQVYEATRSLTASDIRDQVNLVQSVMQAVMKKDVHYGIIPGCKKPSLYKAGSEVLLSTFRIAVSIEVDDLSSEDCIRYRVRVKGTHQGSGIVVGEGIGECSSDEEKYKWRKASSRSEFNALPEARRRIKYGYNASERKEYEVQQVRAEPADVANTILKMAKKRAQVDMTLTSTAASDCFDQDLEDLPEHLREREETVVTTTTVDGPQSKSGKTAEIKPQTKTETKTETNGAKVTSGMVGVIRAKLAAQDQIDEAALCLQYEVARLEDLSASLINSVLTTLQGQ